MRHARTADSPVSSVCCLNRGRVRRWLLHSGNLWACLYMDLTAVVENDDCNSSLLGMRVRAHRLLCRRRRVMQTRLVSINRAIIAAVVRPDVSSIIRPVATDPLRTIIWLVGRGVISRLIGLRLVVGCLS